MSKWTWPALAAILAVASGSYYLLSQRHERSVSSDPADIEVESFGDDADSEAEGDNTFEMLDDDGSVPPAQGAKTGKAAAGDDAIKTIDDEDDLGETVKDPVVIDDEEEGQIEAASPEK
jgi:hypothetical protein